MRTNVGQFQIDGGGDVAPQKPKVKVSQATVDNVKNDGRGNMGQAAANKSAYGSPGYSGGTLTPNAPASAEYKEATKRVYPNAKATSPGSSSGYANPKAPGNSKAAPKALPPVMTPPSASGATNPNQPGPAKKPKALPPIMPPSASGATNPNQPGPAKKPKALPPVLTPPTGSGATNPNQPGPKATKPKADTKVKVSQATVDAVKKAGKEKSIGATKYKGVSPEYKEAVRRIYQSPAKLKPKVPRIPEPKRGGSAKPSAVK